MGPDSALQNDKNMQPNPTKNKFDEHYEEAIKIFQQKMDESPTSVGILIIKDAELDESGVAVYPKGHFYDVAALLNSVLKEYKITISQQLS